MADTWITDFTHFLDEEGNLVSEPAPAKVLAEYFAAIVFMASFPDVEYPPEYIVKCRRKPNRKPCLEEIVAFIDPHTEDVVWMCPKCQDKGIISNWRHTMWDLSDSEQPVH
jgi:hypothetical protein